MKISKKEVISWFGMLLGCSILAAGFVFFINPYNIVPGGVYGLSIVLHNLFPSIQVGTFGYVFDIPLLIISAVFLGSKLGTKTFVAALTTPLIMNLMSVLSYHFEGGIAQPRPDAASRWYAQHERPTYSAGNNRFFAYRCRLWYRCQLRCHYRRK